MNTEYKKLMIQLKHCMYSCMMLLRGRFSETRTTGMSSFGFFPQTTIEVSKSGRHDFHPHIRRRFCFAAYRIVLLLLYNHTMSYLVTRTHRRPRRARLLRARGRSLPAAELQCPASRRLNQSCLRLLPLRAGARARTRRAARSSAPWRALLLLGHMMGHA